MNNFQLVCPIKSHHNTWKCVVPNWQTATWLLKLGKSNQSFARTDLFSATTTRNRRHKEITQPYCTNLLHVIQDSTLISCFICVSVFSQSLEMWTLVVALDVPRGPRLPAKACPHALPRALTARAQELFRSLRASWLFLSFIFLTVSP